MRFNPSQLTYMHPHKLSKTESTVNTQIEPDLRIMIVDDDIDLLRAMVPLVASWGLSVVSFDKFEAARDELMAGIEADALLVDVRIGSFNGLHLVYLARHLRPTMTLVVMSGFDDPVIRTDTEKAGARFLLKPVPSVALQQLLFREAV
jgi:FixJ family two-component response regulator